MSTLRIPAAILITVTVLLTAAVPAQAGGQPQCSSQLQRRLNLAVAQTLRSTGAPGVMAAVSVPGRCDWSTVRGTANLATGAPLQASDYTRVGSVTKTMTATAILELMDRGRLSLDDPISKYVSGVPNGRHITLRELGNMRSGLFSYTEDEAWVNTWYNNPYRGWTPQELLSVAFKHKPYFAPNTGTHYSNTNYILLGLVIEKLTGRPVGQIFRDWIFRPLGMYHTYLASNGVLPAPFAHGYTEQTRSGAKAESTHWNPTGAWTAGAVVSTFGDMRIWAVAQGQGTLLSRRAQAERLKFVPVPGRTGAYGLGAITTGGWIWHDGDIAGYNAYAGYLPALRASLVVLLNSDITYRGIQPVIYFANIIGSIATPGHTPPAGR